MPPATDPFSDLRRRLQSRVPRRFHAPLRARSAVALVLVSEPGKDLSALFIERTRHPKDPWSGHIALPGGRCAPGDRDRLATSIREAEEETGIVLKRQDSLGSLDDLCPSTPTYPELSVRPFVFGLAKKPRLTPGPEAAGCFWVRLGKLSGSVCERDFLIAGKPRRLPAYRIGRRIIWGITYRILESLFSYFQPMGL